MMHEWSQLETALTNLSNSLRINTNNIYTTAFPVFPTTILPLPSCHRHKDEIQNHLELFTVCFFLCYPSCSYCVLPILVCLSDLSHHTLVPTGTTTYFLSTPDTLILGHIESSYHTDTTVARFLSITLSTCEMEVCSKSVFHFIPHYQFSDTK